METPLVKPRRLSCRIRIDARPALVAVVFRWRVHPQPGLIAQDGDGLREDVNRVVVLAVREGLALSNVERLERAAANTCFYDLPERLARRAGELGKDDAVALWTAGTALAYVVGDLDDGNAMIERALILNPNLSMAWCLSGWVKLWLGEPEAAIAASSALAGRLEQARKALSRLRLLEPSLRLSNLRELFPVRRAEDFAKLEEGMRKAGLRE